MGTGAAEAGIWQGAVRAWREPERVSLGCSHLCLPQAPLQTPSPTPPPTHLPRKPRGQRQENRAVPATTELWQTPRPAQGPEWQGSSSWHHSPTQPGGHLWAETAQLGKSGQDSPKHRDTCKTDKKHTGREFWVWLNRLTTQHSVCEDVIPGLARWVKDPALLWL